MATVYIGRAAPKVLTIPITESTCHADQTDAPDSVKVPPTHGAHSDAKVISGSMSEVSGARKIGQYKEESPKIGHMKRHSQSRRFVNVVKVNNTMDCLVTVSLGKHRAKDQDTGSISSGIDTDPEKSDSEGENSGYSSIGTQSSNCDDDIRLNENIKKLNFNEGEREKEVFYVREFETCDRNCDQTDFKDKSTNGHHTELNKIMSVRGTVRGVKNRVRSGIAAFIQHEEQLKNYAKLEIGKVVVYTTTMGVVRKTYDRCRMVRNILRNLMVRYDERDVFMNRAIQSEVMERLGSSRVLVPQVFVEGQHIGDAEQIERLNEAGELRKFLRPYKRTSALITCEKCGGYQYVLCSICNGSKKSPQINTFMEYSSPLRCMHCDEGGLIKCDLCVDL